MGCSCRRLGLTRDGAPDGEDAVAGFVEEPGLQTERVVFLRHAGPAKARSVAAREATSREAQRRCRGGERNQVGYCNDKLTVHGARVRSFANRMAHDKVVELWKSAYAGSERHILPLLCLASPVNHLPSWLGLTPLRDPGARKALEQVYAAYLHQ